MSPVPAVDDTLRYLDDGGEVGRHLRSGRADATALGPPARWPGALHDALRITLHSDFPHIVYWGEALHTFWNDAARTSSKASIRRTWAARWPRCSRT
jgi:hypothetical protein